MTAQTFLRKAISMRKRLMREKKSHAPEPTVRAAVDYIERWLNHWNPNDAQCRKFISAHRNKVESILPGTGSGCHQAMQRELLNLLQ